MGCCGQVRKTQQFKIGPLVDPRTTASRQSSGSKPTARRREVGEACIYCGNKIAEKVRKTPRGWVKRGWCATCRLEF